MGPCFSETTPLDASPDCDPHVDQDQDRLPWDLDQVAIERKSGTRAIARSLPYFLLTWKLRWLIGRSASGIIETYSVGGCMWGVEPKFLRTATPAVPRFESAYASSKSSLLSWISTLRVFPNLCSLNGHCDQLCCSRQGC